MSKRNPLGLDDGDVAAIVAHLDAPTRTTPFQRAGLALGLLSREFGTAFGCRNLPEGTARAGVVRRTIRHYLKHDRAGTALHANGFELDDIEAAL